MNVFYITREVSSYKTLLLASRPTLVNTPSVIITHCNIIQHN